MSWDESTAVDCEGYGPTIDDSIDLYWNKDFDSVRVRLDYVVAGETGTFDDTFVAVESQGDEWGSYEGVSCVVTVDRNEAIHEDRQGTTTYAVEGSAECDAPLEPFQSAGTVELSTIEFSSGYTEY